MLAALATGCRGGKTAQVRYGKPFKSAVTLADRPGFGAAGRALVLQVVAHPDDDLFFMNPDTLGAIERGVPVVTVYITGGGSFGVNQVPGGPKPPANIPAYVGARQQGLHQAYARMLGAGLFTPWRRTALDLPGGHQAELHSLSHGGRSAELVLLNLDMHTKVPGGRTNLSRIWAQSDAKGRTIVVPGSPVRRSTWYGRQDLMDALVSLFQRYRPTLVCTLDPDPDIQVHDKTHPRGSDAVGYSDHPDHTAAAQLTWQALAQWVDAAVTQDGRVPAFLTNVYRGYYNQRWPYDLPAGLVQTKSEILNDYGGSPSWHCGSPLGCGDYSVGDDSTLRSKKGWVRSTHYRYPTAGPQVVPAPPVLSRSSPGSPRPSDARPAGPKVAVTEETDWTVYGVLGTRAARWRWSPAGGGTWSAPDDLGGGPLAPALSVVRTQAGQDLLFGLRFSGFSGGAAGNTREVVLLDGVPTGPRPGRWTSLGNPERSQVRGRRVGPPTAVAAPDGTVHVFVRNAAKGLSTRVRSATGQWSRWLSLAGGQVQEGLAAVVDKAGRIHVYAAGGDHVHEWTQGTPGGPLGHRVVAALPRPGDVPGAAAGPDGSVLLGYRAPDSATVVVGRLEPGVGRPRWKREALVPGSGFGPLSLLPGPHPGAPPVLGVRDDLGGALLDEGRRTRSTTKGPGGLLVPAGAPAPYAVGRPALLTRGPSGGPALVCLGVDAEPRLAGAPGKVTE
ncbi:PIG-L family deacetylase [Streptomyces sp. HPF1205]|uniref:PIG-L family deacetylase n=1 Tax=Streptomyces sp. HPF1205 TaxID=2873262 RepID=UPI001CED8842|nr:PIG-L family deacetylase [Streptomyces sp. HPF1205]